MYSDKIKAHSAPLFNLASTWSFAIWGINVIRPFSPKASSKHKFILMAINYVTKQVKANSYTYVTQKVVKRLIEKDLICRYSPPKKIVINNAQNFNDKMIVELCTKQKIKHFNSKGKYFFLIAIYQTKKKNLSIIILHHQIQEPYPHYNLIYYIFIKINIWMSLSHYNLEVWMAFSSFLIFFIEIMVRPLLENL